MTSPPLVVAVVTVNALPPVQEVGLTFLSTVPPTASQMPANGLTDFSSSTLTRLDPVSPVLMPVAKLIVPLFVWSWKQSWIPGPLASLQ